MLYFDQFAEANTSLKHKTLNTKIAIEATCWLTTDLGFRLYGEIHIYLI